MGDLLEASPLVRYDSSRKEHIIQMELWALDREVDNCISLPGVGYTDIHSSNPTYGWWKKSCTTRHEMKPYK